MEIWSPFKQLYDQIPKFYYPHLDFSTLEKCKSSICSNPLIDRITSNWKVILMDCSTIIAITCCFAAFLNGSPFVCSAFAIVTISSGVSAFYMRRFATLSDLEDTAKELKETKEKLQEIAGNLEKENNRLVQTNRELQRTNEAFRATNSELQRTNENFRATNRDLQTTNEAFRQTNTHLMQQVAQLTLQATHLRESAEKIREELLRFQRENSHLQHNVRGFDQSLRVLDQQIQSSRTLCDQIAHHLNTQQQGIGQQLDQLKEYLTELRADNRLHERIQALAALQQQTQQATTQLHDLQIQYAQERANFEAIHQALVQFKNQFDLSLRDAVSSMQWNNQQFRENLAGLSSERSRVQEMLSRFFPSGGRNLQAVRT